MSENSCTARDAPLDIIGSDASRLPRGAAERDFRREKKSAQISPEGRSDAHRTRAKECKACESVSSDSQNRVFGSVWQAA
jgi:hypothetical protein